MFVSFDPFGNDFEGAAVDFARRPTISADASRVAYGIRDPGSGIPNEQINFEDITIDGADLRTVDFNLGGSVGVGDGDSGSPMLSADGCLVAFSSEATDLVPGDGNQAADVFLAHLNTGVTRRESVDSAEMEATGGASLNPDLTIVDGQGILVSESDATDLIASDGNALRDVFERTNVAEIVPFVGGDADASGSINLTDGVKTLN